MLMKINANVASEEMKILARFSLRMSKWLKKRKVDKSRDIIYYSNGTSIKIGKWSERKILNIYTYIVLSVLSLLYHRKNVYEILVKSVFFHTASDVMLAWLVGKC